MSDIHPLSDEQEKELLRKCWYTHNARWFMSVAQEFGLDAANRLNKRTCRALGEAEMRRLVKALGIAAPTNVQELVPVIKAAFRFFTPPPLMDLEVRAVDDRSWEGWMKSCFIHDNVVKAGIAPNTSAPPSIASMAGMMPWACRWPRNRRGYAAPSSRAGSAGTC